MRGDEFLDKMEYIDADLIEAAYRQNSNTKEGTAMVKKSHTWRRTIVMIAAIVAVLSLCGFAAYEAGFFDFWLQKPSIEPTETVQSAIENQIDKEYTLTVRVEEIVIDEAETKAVLNQYIGSELAKKRGWSDSYLSKHFVVVKARYYVEYDHTKTFQEDGLIEQYFYLTQDENSGEWTIVDNTKRGCCKTR